MLLCFELSMPNRGSWNNKWSGDGSLFAVIHKVYKRDMDEQLLSKIINQRNFHYRWEDGWCACVSVRRVDSKEAAKIRRNSKGFCGYNWMIKSILTYGEIRKIQNEIYTHKHPNGEIVKHD